MPSYGYGSSSCSNEIEFVVKKLAKETARTIIRPKAMKLLSRFRIISYEKMSTEGLMSVAETPPETRLNVLKLD